MVRADAASEAAHRYRARARELETLADQYARAGERRKAAQAARAADRAWRAARAEERDPPK